MRGLNLKSFKKVAEDENSATMMHKDGHKIVIAKKQLPALHKKQLEKLPMHKYAKGGEVMHYAEGDLVAEPIEEQGPGAPLQVEPIDAPAVNTPSAPPLTVEPIAPEPAVPAVPERVPAQAAPQGAPPVQFPDLYAASQAEKTANTAAANAQAAQGKAESSSYDQLLAARKKVPTAQQRVDQYRTEGNALQKAYADKEIDPNHYWKGHSKIAAGIGMLLGGAGAGGGGTNQALGVVQEGIKRDIDAQKNSQDKAHNLWKMNRANLETDIAADLKTEDQLWETAKYQIAQAGSNAKAPLAKAAALKANALIDQNLATLRYKQSLLQPTQVDTVSDPADKLKALIQFGMVPPAEATKIAGEIDTAKNTVANSKGIDEAFEQAVKDSRPMEGGLSGTSIRAFIPGRKTPGQQAFLGRMAPTVGDITGTVRQAEFESIEHNLMPQFGDSDDQIATKRKSLADYKASKSASSLSKAYGMDLTHFPSTNVRGLADQQLQKANSVERYDPKTGKTALFDGATQAFIGYK